MLSEISRDNIAATMQKLASFDTRGNFSDPEQKDRGIGAARRWILDQFKSYSPRLDVSFDPYKVKKQGTRILRDVEVVNVVAVLPGTTQPDTRLIVGAHYDSLNVVRRPDAPEVTPEGGEPAADDVIDFEKSVEAPAPGVTDNAAGTALVLELARVMSQYRFEKTIVFIAFGGEEIGLVGSNFYALKAKDHKDQIEAVLNNDVVGVAVAGDGHAESGLVHVFSEEPADSASRELARYIRETAQRYVPGFSAEPVFRQDRFSRGGDQSPFNINGFTAVRFTSAAENLGIQHTANDTFDKSSPDYAMFPKDGVNTATFTTFDGLAVVVELAKQGDADWIRLSASGGADDKTKAEADGLNQRWSPWVYGIAAYKAGALRTKLDDLLEPPAPAPAAPTQSAPAGGQSVPKTK